MELLVITRALTAVVIVAAVFGIFLSLANTKQTEKKLINGCMHHVFKQLDWFSINRNLLAIM
ncbi:hypothetical protein PUN28_000613 [Cardiocondyla obscurior]|uniref:Uncharacterized protein n=1 Tax=Cardiocondyla obscurior TaxID=286306 RepID=A0AAW2H0Q4_9HYME